MSVCHLEPRTFQPLCPWIHSLKPGRSAFLSPENSASEELHMSNAYYTSEAMSGDVARAITFEDPKNKFFTSFTLYDEDGYLMNGETHINSKMWKPNPDGSITIHFNAAKDAINNLSSGGKPFNYIVRHYGVSQLVIDGKSKTLKPEVLSG